MADDLTGAFNLIKKFEGCKLNAYQDLHGVWTIGWGHTGDVTSGQVITQAVADETLTTDVNSFDAKVKALVSVPITNNELCALVSFTYNEGEGSLSRSTLLHKLNSGAQLTEVAAEFARWVYVAGQVEPGLVARRQAEAALFLGQDPNNPQPIPTPVAAGAITISVVEPNVRFEVSTQALFNVIKPYLKIGV